MNNETIIIEDVEFKTGDKVECYIGDMFIENARIYIPEKYELKYRSSKELTRRAFICQNKRNGNPCKDRFEFRLSWEFSVLKDKDGVEYLTDSMKCLALLEKSDELVSVISSVFGINNE